VQDERGFLSRIRFSRGLNLWQATSRGLGLVAATVIFVLLGEASAAVGPLVPVAILLTSLLVVLNGLGYAELAVGSRRSGGAYTSVHHESSSGGWAFLTGWALALAGLGLCALLAQGAARHLGLLLEGLLPRPVPASLLAMGLAVLVVAGACLGSQIGRRLSFTLPMVILLLVLALLAAPRLPAVDYGTVYSQPGPAMVLLMVAFTGLETITGTQGEIRRPAINLPRTLLGVPLLAAVLGAGLAVVAGPHLTAVTGAPLASLGEAVAGATGRAAVLVTGVAVLVLSLGQALTMVVRHLYVMSRDGFWPEWACHTHPRRRVPIRLILLVGLLLLPTVWVPTGVLGRVGGLLYLLVLGAVNLTLARRSRKGTESSFRLPFHPWVPALAVAVDLLLIPLWGLTAAALAAGCLCVGALIYTVYGRSHHIEAQEGVTIFRPADEERAPSAFRVLVPIADAATAERLLRIAGRLAQAQEGEVLALQVVVVREPVPLEAGRQRAQASRTLLDQALAFAHQEGLPVETMTRVARSAAQGILDTAAEERTDLIVLDWRGPPRSRGASVGPIVDAVLRDAPCDVLVVRGATLVPPRRILVPTAGGLHARAAARLALALAEPFGAETTLMCVQVGPTNQRQTEETRCQLADTLEGLSPEHPPQQKVVTASSVIEGILQEAQQYDLVFLGVSEESLFDRLVFGSVPLQVAARVPTTALVQGHRGITGLWTRRLLRALQNILPALNSEEQWEVRRELSKGAQPGIDYFVLIVLSCVIAALGLLLDSPAVVIGAMLVAPLMTPILAFSLGLVLGDLRLIRFSVEAILKGVTLAVVIAAFIGLLSPLNVVTGEMAARARPTLLDMVVALVSGMAGAYALARKDVSAALPGVAVAAALMPPLATVGLGLALGEIGLAGRAFLLFATNIAAISLAGGIVFLLLGIRPHAWGPESRRRLRQRLAASFLLLLAISIPLGIILSNVVQGTLQRQTAEEVLAEYTAAEGGGLVDLEMEWEEADLHIVASVRSSQPIEQQTVEDMQAALSEGLGYPVRLEVIVLPVVHPRGR
jgi:uncharacterized hydrophobic protein (TIGR00271 family)